MTTAVPPLRSQSHSDQLISHFAMENSCNAARLEAIAKGNDRIQLRRKIELTLRRGARSLSPFAEFNLPPVARKKVQHFTKCFRYCLVSPPLRFMNRNQQFKIAMPRQGWPVLGAISELNCRRHQQRVIDNRLPFGDAIGLQTLRREFDVFANPATLPAAAHADARLNNMNSRYARLILGAHSFTPSSSPARFSTVAFPVPGLSTLRVIPAISASPIAFSMRPRTWFARGTEDSRQ